MTDPDHAFSDGVPGGALLPRTVAQPSSAHARAGRKSNSTSPDSHERHHTNSGKQTLSEVRSDSPLLTASKSTTVERPLSGSHDSTAASTPPENKSGAVYLPQPSPQHAHANRGYAGHSSSPTRPHVQLPVHEPWNHNPQPGARAQPVDSSASSRPEVYPTAHAQLAHAPIHTPCPSQNVSGGGVEKLWGPKEEQHGTDEGIETGCDLPSPVSPHGHAPRAGMVKRKIICITLCKYFVTLSSVLLHKVY